MSTEEKQLSDKVVHIGRVTKVVKGGRIFKFTALVVVGDHDGNVRNVEILSRYCSKHKRDS